MRFAHLFPPIADDGTVETVTIGNKTTAIKEVAFANIPGVTLRDAMWVDGGSAVLFTTPSRCIGIIKICAVHTTGLSREHITTAVYLASVTSGEKFICRCQALANSDERITVALNREIDRALYPDATPEQLLDTLRTLAEHAITGGTVIHDGSVRTTDPLLQKLAPVPCISKTTGVLTSKHRPVAMALLTAAPANAWQAPVGDATLVRLHERASHVFLVEHATSEVLSLLYAWSADMTFPGYPYPLVLADQLARVTNNERDAFKVIIASDEQASRIISGEVKASDAHAMLEHILYGKEM